MRWPALLALACAACGGGPPAVSGDEAIQRQHAELVREVYGDAVASALTMDHAIHALTSSVTEGSFEASKRAFLGARVPWALARAIPTPLHDRVEGWPIDARAVEAWVTSSDEPIHRDRLIARGIGGWRLVELALFGAEGDRSSSALAAAPRWGALAVVASDLLLSDLRAIQSAERDPRPELRAIADGAAALARRVSKAELAPSLAARGGAPGRPSDSTITELTLALAAIEGVWRGRYGDTDGAGLDERMDAARIGAALSEARAAVAAIEPPFHRAIQDEVRGRDAVRKLIDAFEALATALEGPISAEP